MRIAASAIAAPSVAAAATSAYVAPNEACWSRRPAATKPTGPVAEINVLTLAETRARRAGGVRSVTEVKKREKYRPEQTPFAAIASATP